MKNLLNQDYFSDVRYFHILALLLKSTGVKGVIYNVPLNIFNDKLLCLTGSVY